MTKTDFERARTEAQKDYRVSEIVNATTRLLEDNDFDQINLTEIAKEAKFTRSNLYKYFETKEEIFLELLKRDIVQLRKALEKKFRKDKSLSADRFAKKWVTVQLKHKRLIRLFSILYTSIEKNSSMQKLIEFKELAREELNILSDLLKRIFPSMTDEETNEFMHTSMALGLGLYPMSNLSEKQLKAMETAGILHTKAEFDPFFERAICYLIRGFIE
jgi:AcrR family transcriptional regulator